MASNIHQNRGSGANNHCPCHWLILFRAPEPSNISNTFGGLPSKIICPQGHKSWLNAEAEKKLVCKIQKNRIRQGQIWLYCNQVNTIHRGHIPTIRKSTITCKRISLSSDKWYYEPYNLCQSQRTHPNHQYSDWMLKPETTCVPTTTEPERIRHSYFNMEENISFISQMVLTI